MPGAAAASGEPARASVASRPNTAEALSVPRRGPSAGGPTDSPPPPPPPLGRGRSQREERPRGQSAGGGAGSPGAGRPQRFAGVSCPRPAKGAGKRDPSSLLRQAAAPTHSLCHPPSLSPSPVAHSPAAAQIPPLPRHHSPPPDSHPSLRYREISRLTGPTLREHDCVRVRALPGAR